MNEKHQAAIIMLRKSGIELERRCEMYEEYISMSKEKGVEEALNYLTFAIRDEKVTEPA